MNRTQEMTDTPHEGFDTEPEASPTVGLIMIAILTAVIIGFAFAPLLESGPSRTIPQAAQRACQFHEGVRAVNQDLLVVCLDGAVRNANDFR